MNTKREILDIVQVNATDIPDAWFQAISKIIDHGYDFVIDRGSYTGDIRLQFKAFIAVIQKPYNEPWDMMLPHIPAHYNIPNPVEPGYVEEYMPYLMTNHVADNEQYTYGSRMYDQIPFWVDILKEKPHTNQVRLQVAQPTDYKLEHSPCLTDIGLQVVEGELRSYPSFRSWDLWGGFPANLAGISVLIKDMADRIGIPMGPMTVYSKGLHIYSYVNELVALRTGKEPLLLNKG